MLNFGNCVFFRRELRKLRVCKKAQKHKRRYRAHSMDAIDVSDSIHPTNLIWFLKGFWKKMLKYLWSRPLRDAGVMIVSRTMKRVHTRTHYRKGIKFRVTLKPHSSVLETETDQNVSYLAMFCFVLLRLHISCFLFFLFLFLALNHKGCLVFKKLGSEIIWLQN